MRSRTIVGVGGLAILLAVAVYLLFQIPLVFSLGGIFALVAILFALVVDAPAS